MNNNWIFLHFSFWGDLLVSASVIPADTSSRNEPAETAKWVEWWRGREEGRERRREGIYFPGLTVPSGQACPC